MNWEAIQALNAADGSILWTTTIGASMRASPAVGNGVLYIPALTHRLYAVDALSGNVLKHIDLGGRFSFDLPSSPAIVDGSVYVGATFSYALFAFNLPVSVITTCNGQASTLVGTLGDDVLVGTPANDVITRLSGKDGIDGLAGNDVICGGDGDDTLEGGPGNDTLRGELGQDDLFGNDGRDRLEGGSHTDLLVGGNDSDILLGQQANDELYGGIGDDRLNGGSEQDLCNGATGTDTAINCEVVNGVP